MPADWITFVSKVSSKIAAQSVKNNQDFAQLIADSYSTATVGKAQSPYGNTHQSGQKQIMVDGFKQGMDSLMSNPLPSFVQKETLPPFADLKEPLPTTTPSQYGSDKDFIDWSTKNNKRDFTFFHFFENLENYPTNINDAIPLIARRLIFQYDGSSEFKEWLKTLSYGRLGSIGSQVYDSFNAQINGGNNITPKVGDPASGATRFKDAQVNLSQRLDFNIDSNIIEEGPHKIISGVISKIVQEGNDFRYSIRFVNQDGVTEIKEIVPGTLNLQIDYSNPSIKTGLNYSKKLLQRSYEYDTKKIPTYITPELIAKFTYSSGRDGNYSNELNRLNYESDSPYYYYTQFIDDVIKTKIDDYGDPQKNEVKDFRDLQQEWIRDLASGYSDATNSSNDPYEIMAKGVIDYWKSSLNQPLSPTPPVPPANLNIPLGGIFYPITYGDQTELANNLRRAFNSGKTFKYPGMEMAASQIVAIALAYSFATHLLGIKFVYGGGISTPAGPVPMLGFVPAIF